MTITTRIHTFFFGQAVGQDAFGNRYFQARRAPKAGRRTRWVLYNGLAEPSKVPPEWHGWLHYTHDAPQPVPRHAWAKPPQPNLTGTKGAYFPSGDLRRNAQHAPTMADIHAWTPD